MNAKPTITREELDRYLDQIGGVAHWQRTAIWEAIEHGHEVEFNTPHKVRHPKTRKLVAELNKRIGGTR